ncbi:HD domain-containing phosphohydrolase [Robertmurraya korlensis]|uniref:HD domain-containing phosphohydrolase n=1 Tax=Robertmurraya korlensis TaxID=519977 RepID=UPI0008243945|nr:HD domain-containing phosphohydrolase [Robertmurraya korlensis]
MKTYKQFIRQLITNYIIGSLLAVFGVGGTLMFSTIDITANDQFYLLLIMILSVLCMFICEAITFYYHIKPIRAVFNTEYVKEEEVRKGLKQLYQFPKLTVKRIMLPHFLGLSIPATTLAAIFIIMEKLHVPMMYIFYSTIAAIFVAILHALTEFYLTLRAIQPISLAMKDMLRLGENSLFFENDMVVPIQKKFQSTVLIIGVLPVLLFLLAAQIKWSQITGMEMQVYWQWAGLIIVFTVIYSILVSRFMTRDIESPLRQLQELMENVKNENYNFIKSNVYTDEFSKVFIGFNHMVNAINERESTNKKLLESFMISLSATLDARDPYTSGHSSRVAKFSLEIGHVLGLEKDDLELLYQTALLHDIGKIGVPDYVLLKEGKLTEEEFAHIKAHPVIGEHILKQVQPASKVARMLPGIRHHHERMDGKGYPDGLKDQEIPLYGRIIAVADSFDAMTSDRPYRKGMVEEKALNILLAGKDTQWDSAIVDLFISIRKSKQNEKRPAL